MSKPRCSTSGGTLPITRLALADTQQPFSGSVMNYGLPLSSVKFISCCRCWVMFTHSSLHLSCIMQTAAWCLFSAVWMLMGRGMPPRHSILSRSLATCSTPADLLFIFVNPSQKCISSSSLCTRKQQQSSFYLKGIFVFLLYPVDLTPIQHSGVVVSAVLVQEEV